MTMKRWIALLLGCLPLFAGAWNATGHRQVAARAWEVMDAPVRAEVVRLLKQHPDYARWQARQRQQDPDYGAFLEASIWADEIRSDRRFYAAREPKTPLLPGFPDMARHSDWHYQDESGGVLAERLPELAHMLADKRRKASERAYALVWMLHMVGDLHQPLHTWGRSDRGGNQFYARFFGRPKERISLHRYWDSLPEPAWGRAPLSGRVSGKSPETATGDVKRWLRESRALAKKKAYPPLVKGLGDISPKFHQQAKTAARGQIARAGYRLGMWFNLLLQAKTGTPQAHGEEPFKAAVAWSDGSCFNTVSYDGS